MDFLIIKLLMNVKLTEIEFLINTLLVQPDSSVPLNVCHLCGHSHVACMEPSLLSTPWKNCCMATFSKDVTGFIICDCLVSADVTFLCFSTLIIENVFCWLKIMLYLRTHTSVKKTFAKYIEL